MPPRKKLSTRLAELEQTAETGVELSDREKTMLVSVLGKRDAMFWPWRWSLGHQPPIVEIRNRQRDYLNGTQGIVAKADGKTQWKDAHYIRQRLIAAKMVTATHSSGQVTSLFLTADGEMTARSLVGDRLYTLSSPDVKRTYAAILLHRLVHGAPIREHELFGCVGTGDPSQWDAETEIALPLLTAGIVKAETDTICRIAYVVVDDVELKDAPTVDHITAEERWEDVYLRAFDDERNVLRSAEPRDADEIFIPHSATR
jgi:hypothetical protein